VARTGKLGSHAARLGAMDPGERMQPPGLVQYCQLRAVSGPAVLADYRRIELRLTLP
jgi:hypothetical protein